MYFVIAIMVGVVYAMGAIMYRFRISKNPISSKYLNHGTLIEVSTSFTGSEGCGWVGSGQAVRRSREGKRAFGFSRPGISFRDLADPHASFSSHLAS